MAMVDFECCECGEELALRKRPKFCPYCASEDIRAIDCEPPERNYREPTPIENFTYNDEHSVYL